MLLQAINNLTHDITIVQHHLTLNQDAGFSDMTRLLESMSIKLVGATYGLNLYNKNFLHPNFPAIDLADDAKRTAVQVTANADAKKIRHTLKMFAEHKVDEDYDTLLILGFIDRSKIITPAFCTVLRTGDLVSLLTDKNDTNLVQDVADAVQQHTDFSRIHPYDDRNCLEIVLHCIDRNAVKHRMVCEGSYKKMVKGLNEISELISHGTIDRKSKAKSLDDYRDGKIKTFLSEARDSIGRILAVVNQCRDGRSDFVVIPFDRFREIDDLKLRLIDQANAEAKRTGIELELRMI